MSDSDDTYTTTASSSSGGGGDGNGGVIGGNESSPSDGSSDSEETDPEEIDPEEIDPGETDPEETDTESEDDECYDRFNAERLRRAFHFNAAAYGMPFPACVADGKPCRERGDAGHTALDGLVKRPFQTCDSCDAKGRRMFTLGTRHANGRTYPPGTLIGLLWRADLTGAHDRGHLCRQCTRMEIRSYWDRRILENQRPATAALTCTCVRRIQRASGTLCLTHREELYIEIEDASDANAGPGGWLSHLYRRNGQARQTPNCTTLGIRPTNHVQMQNACRCGENISQIFQPFSASSNSPGPGGNPVALCTACSGVHVDDNYAWVRRGEFDRRVRGQNGERRSTRIARQRANAPIPARPPPDLRLGRVVPVIQF